MSEKSADAGGGLTLAPDLLPGIFESIDRDAGEEYRETAREFATRAANRRGANRSPAVQAAASAYLAGLLTGEGVTQHEIAAAADVSKQSIRKCYRELSVHEGVDVDALGWWR